MPAVKKPSWLARVVAAAPGLAALVYGFALPGELQPVFGGGLAVLVFATLAILYSSRGTIRRWPVRRTVRRMAACAAGALVCLLLFAQAQSVLIRGYRYPADAEEVTVVLLPVRFALSPPDVTFPYLDCRDAMTHPCAGVESEAKSADELMGLLSSHDRFDVQLPGGMPRFTSIVVLLLLYGAAAVLLVMLSGIAAVRGITPALLAKEFGEAEEEGPKEAPTEAPQGASTEAQNEAPKEAQTEAAKEEARAAPKKPRRRAPKESPPA